MTDLPIEDVLPRLRSVLRAHTGAVLQAPPGAGKTTRVPIALLEEPWLAGQRIVMLEPRRLAARTAAQRMAQMLGEPVGATVGYRMRMDTRVGPGTRIEVVTEGVLTRFLQEDPTLEGIGAILFDEFHERSVQSDLGLALTLESKSVFREDLRVLVMSATLDGAPVAKLLGNAPIVTSEGRSYPVETRYLDRMPQDQIEPVVTSAVLRAVAEEEGDILVFLPGAAEIHRVAEGLNRANLGENVRVMPLYGNLSQAEQERAIEPSAPGRRKIVLATSIAETSLTIEGVRVVVDSGLMRVPRFSPQSGMTRLATVPVSRASADQRRGRAGRLGPGVCYRLWTRNTHEHLTPHTDPEMLHTDLAPVALELAQWGVADPGALAWLDTPPSAAFEQARELLRELGALGPDGTITEHGRRMADLALHPRLAHMVLRAREQDLGGLACDLAALLSERDIFRSEGGPVDADVRLRLQALHDTRQGGRRGDGYGLGYRIDSGTVWRVLQFSDALRRQLRVRSGQEDMEAAGMLLALAYPDRIGQQRTGQAGRFRLRNGRSAHIAEPQLLSGATYLAIAHLDGDRQDSRIFLAAPVSREDLEQQFADQIVEEESVEWDADAKLVRAHRRQRLGALILKESSIPDPDPDAVVAALLDGIAQEGPGVLPWTKDARRLRERMEFLHRLDPAAWPDASDEALVATLPEWLGPYVTGIRRLDELQRLDLEGILAGRLTWEQRQAIDRLAPTHLEVPSGSRISIDYGNPEAPVLAVRLQEVFGMTETPRIADGQVPLLMHLLSPAHRPVQVTQDLESFWRNTYFDVRKDLRGRYPKHYWPENPLEAEPTSRAKRRT